MKVLINRKKVLFLLLTFLLLGCQKKDTFLLGSVEDAVNQTEVESSKDQEIESDQICVYICGAVKKEGVYTLSKGSRVCDLIKLAGGLKKGADTNGVNQALILEDEEKIYIPRRESGGQMAAGGSGNQGNDNLIDLNTASVAELMTLPGIGESKATSIIAYREEKGGFQAIEEIKNISGIKDGVFEQLKDKVVVK